MKLDNIIVMDENGDASEPLNKEKFVAFVMENVDVKEFVIEGDDGPQVIKPIDVVKGLADLAAAGDELEPEFSDYQELFDFLVEKLQESADHKDKLKEDKKKASEEKKLAKAKEKEETEKQKEELAKRQTSFVNMMKKGSAVAAKDFAKSLKSFGKDLPDHISISVNESGKGFGVVIDKDATEDEIGRAAGYFVQQSENSEFMARSSGFMFGDLCNHMTDQGLFISTRAAALCIADKSDGKISQRGVESYARMATRIPLELRNSEVVDKCYLDVSNASLPKKSKGEDDEAFKARLEAHNKDRLELTKKISDGDISKPADVRDKVLEMQIKHGLKEKKDPAQRTIKDYLQDYFLCDAYLGLTGIFDEGVVIFKPKGSKDQYTITEAELKERQETARMHLVNALVEFDEGKIGVTYADLQEGEVEIEIPILDENKKKTGKTEPGMVKVFPRPFFDIEKKEEEESDEESDEDDSEE